VARPEVRGVCCQDGGNADGDGTLLDHSIFMYGSKMSNSDMHNNYPEPNVLMGGGNGKMKIGGNICCHWSARGLRICT
jgi:hypothetical protein